MVTAEERREQKREYQKRWRKEHPNYHREYSTKTYTKHGDRYRIYARKGALKQKYGISLEEYDKFLQQQDGACAICGNLPKRYRLAVDHDHVTNRVRALLCTKCNTNLAALEDVEWRKKAEQYLQTHA